MTACICKTECAECEGDIATLILDRNDFDKLGRRFEAALASIEVKS